jgi:hypothetical protein
MFWTFVNNGRHKLHLKLRDSHLAQKDFRFGMHKK